MVTPFLPGDSLLFAAGTFAALGSLDLWLLVVLLIGAAIMGDTVNYWVGAWIGPRAFSGNVRFLRKDYLDRTHAFYEKHGGKTIILARFVPDHPDLRAVRGRRRRDELPEVHHLQRRRRGALGGALRARPGTSSATCRWCGTTSAW